MINLVLLEPEIPQNTGNIARTCAATGCRLHLIRPLGFEISDSTVKRAGLDYWHLVDLHIYDNLQDFYAQNPSAAPYMASTKAAHRYSDVQYTDGDFIMFGKETRGIPEDILAKNYNKCLRIPMIDGARSLNLANSVAIVAYEALRQLNFPHLETRGHLTAGE